MPEPQSHNSPSRASEPAQPGPARKTWQTPELEELVVHQSARRPDPGRDGGVRDCSRS